MRARWPQSEARSVCKSTMQRTVAQEEAGSCTVAQQPFVALARVHDGLELQPAETGLVDDVLEVQLVVDVRGLYAGQGGCLHNGIWVCCAKGQLGGGVRLEALALFRLCVAVALVLQANASCVCARLLSLASAEHSTPSREAETTTKYGCAAQKGTLAGVKAWKRLPSLGCGSLSLLSCSQVLCEYLAHSDPWLGTCSCLRQSAGLDGPG